MDPAEIEKSVGDLEVAVDRLRSLYEQYFMGFEKLEPTVPRKEVDRRIHALRKEQIRNTAMRFRFQMILQRYSVYQTHWQRICREIENGTYKRHVLRAEQRFAEDGPGRRRRPTLPPPDAKPSPQVAKELAALDAEFAPIEELGDADLMLEEEEATARRHVGAPPPPPPPVAPVPAPPKGPVWRKVEPTPPRHSPPPAPVTAPGSRATSDELSEARVRQIYAQYVEAKRRGNESTAAITYEGVAKSLRESSAKLRQKLGKAVDFEVAVKDGKAILKPVIK